MSGQTKSFKQLEEEWKDLQKMTDPQKRGKAFEPWLKDLFLAGGLHAVGSFTRDDPDAELDGAVHYGINTFLLEAKWKNGPLNADPGIKLRDRVDDGTGTTYGLLISVSGFNDNAVKQADRKTPLRLFLVDESHLTALMKEEISVEAWLRTLLHLAARRSRACIPIDDILAEAHEYAGTDEHTSDTGGTFLFTPLPMRNLDLIGRDRDLEKLEKRIQETQRVLLINGLGGIGKTEVCKRFFMDHYHRYAAAGWVDYVGAMEDSLVHAVEWESPTVRKRLHIRPDDPPEERFNKIKHFLHHSGLETLLVVDNIGNAGDKGLDMLRRLPESVKIMATSRLDIRGFDAHRLDFLSDADCLELFYSVHDCERDDEAVAAVTARCGRHTLTVELLARTARNAGQTARELLETLEQKGFHLDEAIGTFWHDETDYKPLFGHLETIFQLSEVTEEERHILANVSVLPSVYIGVADIRQWLDLETGKNIGSLVRKGWMRRDKMKIYMHPVVREVIRFKTEPNAVMCEKLVLSLARKLKFEPDENPLSKEGYLIFAASLLSYLDEDNPNLAVLTNNLAEIFYPLGRLEEALEMQLKTLNIRKKVLDENHLDLAECYNNLSLMYKALGRLEEALEVQLKTLSIVEQVLDKNHPHLATSYNNLSLIYKALGRLEEALEGQLKTVNIFERVLDKNHPDLAQSYNNLSAIYQSQGRLDDALEVQLKALIIREQVLDKNHPGLALTYNNLAMIYMDMKDYTAAETYARKAVAIMQTLFPGGHPDLDGMMENLERIRKKL